MRILILGGDGMLGHQLLKSWRERHEVRVTLHRSADAYAGFGLFDAGNSDYGIDVRDFDSVRNVVEAFKPSAVVNAAGIVKQRAESKDAVQSIEVNALLPHRLSVLCEETQMRLVHLSTDCVFSGSVGKYAEGDPEDARDVYGRSKLLGEVDAPHAVTLRTSIIGLELTRKKSLIEWFLSQRGSIRGFRKAVYSGFTTQEMARIIERVLVRHPDLSGLWHVASEPINKYDLLKQLKERLGRKNIDVQPSDELVCDRSLDAARFNQATGYQPPSWDEMLDELAQAIRERES